MITNDDTPGLYAYPCWHSRLICLSVTTHPADMHTSDRHTRLNCIPVTTHPAEMHTSDDTPALYAYQWRRTRLQWLPTTKRPVDMHTGDNTPACYAYQWRHTRLICLSETTHQVVMVANDMPGWYANQWRHTRLLWIPVTTGPVDMLTSDDAKLLWLPMMTHSDYDDYVAHRERLRTVRVARWGRRHISCNSYSVSSLYDELKHQKRLITEHITQHTITRRQHSERWN